MLMPRLEEIKIVVIGPAFSPGNPFHNATVLGRKLSEWNFLLVNRIWTEWGRVDWVYVEPKIFLLITSLTENLFLLNVHPIRGLRAIKSKWLLNETLFSTFCTMENNLSPTRSCKLYFFFLTDETLLASRYSATIFMVDAWMNYNH